MKDATNMDAAFMAEALHEAKLARDKDEVPVGAVITLDGVVVARAHNTRETSHDATAHAEILAIREASEKTGDWRLEKACLYVTLEPCLMCAGAILQSRIPRVVFGTADPKAGAVVSLYKTLEDARLNHRCHVTWPLMQEDCAGILQTYFRQKRSSKKGDIG